MKTTEENNKLIAEFMGFQKTDIGWYDFEEILNENVHILNGGNIFDLLQFNTSWDWLMPVVREINKTEYDEWEGYGDLAIAVSSASIEDSYNRVIDAIKWYNEQK